MEDQIIYSLARLLLNQSIALLATEIEKPNSALLYYDEYGRWISANEAHKVIALKILAERKIQLDNPHPYDEIFESRRELEESLPYRFGWLGLPSFIENVKPKTTSVQTIRNEYEFSGLLHFPNKKDFWCEVIDVMTMSFHNKHNKLPTKNEAWAELIYNPPSNYGLQNSSDELTLPGVIKGLKRRAFHRRWVKYTS